jgi:hypothetical protein
MRRFIYFGGLFIVESDGGTFYFVYLWAFVGLLQACSGVKAKLRVIYNRMYRKSYVMPATRANKISKLSVDSDSDSDSDESCVSADSSSASASSTSSVEERVSSLAAPSSHAAFASQETSPPFRVWKADEGESRFTTEKNNIFSSPFSRKKVAWSRPRFRSEDSTSAPSSLAVPSASASAEGWVSIEKGIRSTEDDDLPDYAPPTPSASEDAEDAPVSAKPPQEFPSLLKRGSGSVEDQQNALAWAEKIKKNLDNAEKMRAVNKKQKEDSSRFHSGLSFFKRGVSGLQ